MSYGSYNNYNHRGGFDHHRRDRINEDDVPESKHTIFIRGLPGDMSTDEIKDHFEDRIGPVSFDFVKVSPDQQRLFVAVRFETRDDAKEAMARYKDNDLLGRRCDLSWFKDIRRYAQYQAATGGRGGMRGRGNFRGRGFQQNRGGYERDSYGTKRRYSDRERSESREKSRSRSRGRDSTKSKSVSRSRSRSLSTRSRSRSNERGRRSVSRDSAESRKKDSDRERDSSVDGEKKKKKKEKKQKKKRSKRSRSSSRSASDGELRSDDEKKNGKSIFGRDPTASPVSMNQDSPSPPPAPPITQATPLKFNLKKKEERISPAAVLQNTSFSIGIDTDEPPRRLIRKLTPDDKPPIPVPVPVPAGGTRPTTNIPATDEYQKQLEEQRAVLVNGLGLPPPPCPPSFPKEESPVPPPSTVVRPQLQSETPSQATSEPPKKKEKKEELVADTPPPSLPSSSVKKETPMKPSSVNNKYPATARMFAELKNIQSKAIKSVKSEPKEEEIGGLRLSNLAMQQEDDESEKLSIREQRLAALDEMTLERFLVRKKKLEENFRSDCQTYAFVTKKLLAKDASLEQALRLALIENMEDLEKQLFEQVDIYLEQCD